MDVVSDALRYARLETRLYCRLTGAAPWNLAVDLDQQFGFHLVLRGHCSLLLDEKRFELDDGDLIVVNQRQHRVGQPSSAPITSLRQILAGVPPSSPTYSLAVGVGRASTEMVCGEFRFDSAVWNPFLSALPEVVHLRRAETNGAFVHAALESIQKEYAGPGPASGLLLERLGDLLFVDVLRNAVAARDDRGWLAAVRHPGIGAAISAIHADPAAPWTVDELAGTAAMSRTTFAERFVALAGCSPIDYLTRWRMVVAADLLTRSQLPIEHIGQRVGYRSSSTFSRVFKSETGTPPGQFRASLDR